MFSKVALISSPFVLLQFSTHAHTVLALPSVCTGDGDHMYNSTWIFGKRGKKCKSYQLCLNFMSIFQNCTEVSAAKQHVQVYVSVKLLIHTGEALFGFFCLHLAPNTC